MPYIFFFSLLMLLASLVLPRYSSLSHALRVSSAVA
jgi:hypothetical protein